MRARTARAGLCILSPVFKFRVKGTSGRGSSTSSKASRRVAAAHSTDIFIKADMQLQQDLITELKRQPAVNAADIDVSVHQGVVTLSGQVTETLRARHKVQVTVLPSDLSSAEAIENLTADVKSLGLGINILVNNAGLGVFENFLDASFTKQVEQIHVNIRALVSLTYAFAPAMVAAHRGGIINIASTAAFQPLAGATVYAASKAFVLHFSEGLALELEKTGVEVTAACPGPVATQFSRQQ